MASNGQVCNSADEDYIDMEVSTSSNFFCYSSINSPPQTREFEFQMSSSISHDKETTTSPADELFYKGKLLPLHLPPRLQMVQKLLHNSNTSSFNTKTESSLEEEHYTTPSITSSTRPSTDTNTTPLESCNISPCESRRVSSELNPDEYFFEWSTELSGFIADHPKNSWSKKLKLTKIKDSSLGQKLKASRSYLKSLFTKSGCSDESCAKPACNMESRSVSKAKECLNKYIKVAKRNPFGYIENERYHVSDFVLKSINKEMVEDGGLNNSQHRRSFSGAIKRHSATTKGSSTSSSGSSSSSSSFSFNLSGCYDLQLLKRSISANSEIETSIEGAIAHCKQSQQLLNSKKTVNEVGFCSFSASRTATCGDKDRPGVCSI